MPAKTPAPIVQKLAAEIHRVSQNSEVVEQFKHDGSIPTASTPEEFTAFIQKEAKLWGDIVRAAGPAELKSSRLIAASQMRCSA